LTGPLETAAVQPFAVVAAKPCGAVTAEPFGNRERHVLWSCDRPALYSIAL
jgi:hypothetical protein